MFAVANRFIQRMCCPHGRLKAGGKVAFAEALCSGTEDDEEQRSLWVCQLQMWVWCCIPDAVQRLSSCSADVTGLRQAQQQCMQQLAAHVLRMNISLQKAPC